MGFTKRFLDDKPLFSRENIAIVIFLVMLVLLVSVCGSETASLKQLPACLYGCDLYYHSGGIINILSGNSYLANPEMNNEYAWTPPMYNWLVAGTALLFGIDSIRAILIFNIFAQVITMLLFFYIAYKMTGNKYVGLLSAILVNFFFPVLKYTTFGNNIAMPIFIYACYLFYSRTSYKTSTFLGLSLGFLALVHTNIFTGAVLFTGVLVFWKFIESRMWKDKDVLFKYVKFVLLAGAIGFVICLLTWYVPIFIYHLKLPNNIANYDYFDLSRFSGMLIASGQLFREFLFNYSFTSFVSTTFTIINIVVVLGYILLIFDKHKTDLKRFFIILIPGALLISNHFYLVYPLLHTNLFGQRMIEGFIPFVWCIMFAFFVDYLLSIIFNSRHHERGHDASDNTAKIVFILIIAATAVFAVFSNWNDLNNSEFYVAARQPIDSVHQAVVDWIDANTNINTVIMTTNENSFVLSALTGRKGVNFRRAHSGEFVDVDQRYLDAALILYGDNDSLRIQLLKKYNVSYIYWDTFWIQSEFDFDSSGRVVDWFDPLLIRYTPEREEILKENNIFYERLNTWLDPGVRDSTTALYDTLLITPNNYRTPTRPWSDDLQKMLILKKTFSFNGSPQAMIYEVNYEKR